MGSFVVAHLVIRAMFDSLSTRPYHCLKRRSKRGRGSRRVACNRPVPACKIEANYSKGRRGLMGVLTRIFGAGLILLSCTGMLHAETASAFYRGKTISIMVPTGPGGGYGVIGQMIAQHLGRHIPGIPRMIVDFQPGAAGRNATNLFYNVAARDGTVIAMLFRDMPLIQILQEKGVKYDMKRLNYLGSIGPIVNTIALWHTAPANSVQDCMTTEIIMGSTGTGPTMYIVPQLMNKLMGTKFRIVTGYPGAAPVRVAMEKGEVQGMVVTWDNWKMSMPDWIREKKIKTIAQLGISKLPDLPDVPLLTSLVQDPDAKAIFEIIARSGDIGWYLSTPPDVPADRIAALKGAFESMVKDPAFLSDANKRSLDVAPASAEVVTAAVDSVLKTQNGLIKKIKVLLGY
jgi:tripartite-type tricarboxylate transporter receptor subunit TctC